MADLERPRRLRVAALGAVAITGLLLAGCTAAASGDGSTGDGVSYGEISLQYSWIKNEEFAGEFYAYENGYYDEAGFDEVIGISGPDTGVAKLLSGTVQVALNDAASVGAAIAEEDAPLKIIGATLQKNPFTILSLADGGNIVTPEDLIGKTIGVQDSNASVFAALLDQERGGRFAVCPVGDVQSTRRYLGATAVLETTFKSSTGSARLIDTAV